MVARYVEVVIFGRVLIFFNIQIVLLEQEIEKYTMSLVLSILNWKLGMSFATKTNWLHVILQPHFVISQRDLRTVRAKVPEAQSSAKFRSK